MLQGDSFVGVHCVCGEVTQFDIFPPEDDVNCSKCKRKVVTIYDSYGVKAIEIGENNISRRF